MIHGADTPANVSAQRMCVIHVSYYKMKYMNKLALCTNCVPYFSTRLYWYPPLCLLVFFGVALSLRTSFLLSVMVFLCCPSN